MVERPLVSIVIPVYNGANYLKEAIDCALAQTYSAKEVIVVNDGSTDNGNTEKIALSYGTAIRYFSKSNGGVATALNLGIKEMKGEYFSWLSHDDLYFQDKLERQVEFLKTQPEGTIVFGDYELIDHKSRHLEFCSKAVPNDKLLYAMFTGYPINGCTTLIPKICFDQEGLFNEKLRTTQDYEMWFRLLKRFRFKHMIGPVVKTRIHPFQGTRTVNTRDERNSLYVATLDKFPISQILPGNDQEYKSFVILAKRFLEMDLEFAANYALTRAEESLIKSGPKMSLAYLQFKILKTIKLQLPYKLKNSAKDTTLGQKIVMVKRKLSKTIK